jgi:hypothetical protein
VEASEQGLLLQAARRFCRRELDAALERRSAGGDQFPWEALRQVGSQGYLDCLGSGEEEGLALGRRERLMLIAEFARSSAKIGAIIAVHLLGMELTRRRPRSAGPRLGQSGTAPPDPLLWGLLLPTGMIDASRFDDSTDEEKMSWVAPISPAYCAEMIALRPSPGDGLVAMVLPQEATAALATRADAIAAGEPIPLARLERQSSAISEALPLSAELPTDNEGCPLSRLKLNLSAVLLGLSQGALEDAIAYAKQRRQTRRLIIDHQIVRGMLARRLVQYQAAKAFALSVAQQGPAGAETFDSYRQVYLFVGEVAEAVCLDAMQVLGGYGYMKDYPLENRLRACKQLQGITSDYLSDGLGLVA